MISTATAKRIYELIPPWDRPDHQTDSESIEQIQNTEPEETIIYLLDIINHYYTTTD